MYNNIGSLNVFIKNRLKNLSGVMNSLLIHCTILR